MRGCDSFFWFLLFNERPPQIIVVGNSNACSNRRVSKETLLIPLLDITHPTTAGLRLLRSSGTPLGPCLSLRGSGESTSDQPNASKRAVMFRYMYGQIARWCQWLAATSWEPWLKVRERYVSEPRYRRGVKVDNLSGGMCQRFSRSWMPKS